MFVTVGVNMMVGRTSLAFEMLNVEYKESRDTRVYIESLTPLSYQTST